MDMVWEDVPFASHFIMKLPVTPRLVYSTGNVGFTGHLGWMCPQGSKSCFQVVTGRSDLSWDWLWHRLQWLCFGDFG